MPDDAPHFDDQGRLIAPRYRDVYFSAEDGLAETRHVFFEGNDLAMRLAALKPGHTFTLGETGFGTGLNFLAAWQLFEQHAPTDARLEFVSVEGEPLSAELMARALSPWPELSAYRDALIEQWGPIWPGLHRFRFASGRVRLTLLVGEAARVLSSIDARVDAWLLDGFAPSRNPEMWSDQVFAEIARLSANQATLATYTAAGFVRRGLEAVGFEVEKRQGFGSKRDMTAGRYTMWVNRPGVPDDAVVVGGSLAGSFVARALAERGVAVTVIERQQLEDGQLASLKPRVSVLQPKISSSEDPAGRWLREGYALVQRWLTADRALSERAGWVQCGTFQTRPADRSGSSLDRMKRLKRFDEQFSMTGLCRWVTADEAEAEVGLGLGHDGLLVERAGLLRPAGLCAALLDHPRITVRAGCAVESLQADKIDWKIRLSDGSETRSRSVVLANAHEAARLDPASKLWLKPVRGQVTVLDTAAQSGALAGLKRALFFGGYLLPNYQGTQTLGASFVPGDCAVDWRVEEHEAACEKLSYLLVSDALRDEPWRLKGMGDVRGWAGVRTTTPSHRCYAEAIALGLHVSLGHGSHGIASAAAAGEHLASLITGGVREREAR